MGGTIIDFEYYIHKAAIAISKEMDLLDIRSLMSELSNEEFYLIIKAGTIIANDWALLDLNEEPTKPDHKVTPVPAQIEEIRYEKK